MGRSASMPLIFLTAACGHIAPATPHNLRAERMAQLEKIATSCGLPARTLKLVGKDELRFRPPANATYQSVDCVLEALKKTDFPMKMGFVGNEAYDPGSQR